MKNEHIRIGQRVFVNYELDTATGKIESGHAGEWMIRTDDGELIGPFEARYIGLYRDGGYQD